jgi:hypothetical protein
MLQRVDFAACHLPGCRLRAWTTVHSSLQFVVMRDDVQTALPLLLLLLLLLLV